MSLHEHTTLEARAQKANMSLSDFITEKQKVIRQIFQELGFSKSQIDLMFNERITRTDTCVPFEKIDIRKRDAEYRQLFAPYELDTKQLNNILSTGVLFSYDPRQYKQLFQFIEHTGVPVKTFLKITRTTNGCTVLARSPQSLIQNITKMSQALAPFGINAAQWIKMSLIRPTILKQTPDYLLNNIQKRGQFLSQFGFSVQDWMNASQKNPTILDRKAESFIQKHIEMCQFLKPYDIRPAEWVAACLKSPQLFYTDPAYIQQRFHFFINAYESGAFIFTVLDKQNTHHLIQTLLTSPQYLCYSDDNLQLRQKYMDYMNKTTGQATSAVLYRTKKEIQHILSRE